MRFILLSFLILVTFLPNIAFAGDVPRFVSLSSNEVFLRAGPGKQYPVKWIYQRRGYPVEVVREFDHWRKIQDREGNSGWVHKTLLSGQRTAIVTTDTPKQSIWFLRYDETDSQKIARIEPDAILFLKECQANWCRASAQGITGWIERKYLWGIYDSENIE